MLDLSRVLAGPLCTMILGDLGAEVIKVERPDTGDDTRQWGPPWVIGPEGRESAYYLCANRNKRSLAADLREERDRAVVRRLAEQADVVVENFAPGTLERFGLGYQEVRSRNRGVVFCSITGYGVDGPEAGRPGYDFALQARGGWMAITGEPEGEPVKVGVALVDVLTGQQAAIAILAALRERDRSGEGQRVEVALLDVAVAGLVNVGQAALLGRETRRYGNAHATIVPYQAFDAADRPLVVAVGNDAQWRKLCGVLALDALAADPRFATNPARVENRDALVPLLAEALLRRRATEWVERLGAVGVPCELVQTPAEAVHDPALRERGGVWTMEGPSYGPVEVIAAPAKLSRTPAALRRPAPALGEHTGEVRRDGWETNSDRRKVKGEKD